MHIAVRVARRLQWKENQSTLNTALFWPCHGIPYRTKADALPTATFAAGHLFERLKGARFGGRKGVAASTGQLLVLRLGSLTTAYGSRAGVWGLRSFKFQAGMRLPTHIAFHAALAAFPSHLGFLSSSHSTTAHDRPRNQRRTASASGQVIVRILRSQMDLIAFDYTAFETPKQQTHQLNRLADNPYDVGSCRRGMPGYIPAYQRSLSILQLAVP
ncbi:hypothetical protein EV127DRAFT_469581 [Xylaria flabelliformis]|nr:hypothetical protein EV127DRAFT_469581 [Xylaria flabelliformis]